ncbi:MULTISPECIES: hypothetical protein [Pseudomonas]|uniref:Uncharacterized protein n=1 Tax=Pseudomonas wuhanensis TaxID=2954098 RepID=A0ABY9GL52_9PSED|nr:MULTISPECIES: hypothetical protein [unclassified Pseudomonas]WLI10671.1 hypothetical protein PSH65_20730 [Pseudomonas sp. FP603]WLI16488.1 hypothetical protein PSH88_19355 [Pseudomonas sp. FP607]
MPLAEGQASGATHHAQSNSTLRRNHRARRLLATWSQHYDKLTPGVFHGYLQGVQLNGVRLLREAMSSGVAQHTHTPAHCVNLLLPVSLPRQSNTAPNRSILADGLYFLPYDDDFSLSRRRIPIARALPVHRSPGFSCGLVDHFMLNMG